MVNMGNEVQFALLVPAMLTCLRLPDCKPATRVNILRAGLRSSSYGPREPFPDVSYWISTSKLMAALFPLSSPSLVWIVGELLIEGHSGIARLNFPAPDGQANAFPDIVFSDEDKNEEYFNQFDRQGIKVWLQVEPGNTDVSTLIDVVLNRYASHPCVIGFGVDVEWYKWNQISSKEGTTVSDSEARAWSEKVRSFNPVYQLFLKHWQVEKMPPFYRTGMMFLDDSQEFSDLADMVNEFTHWGEAFVPSPVGFQIGYEADQHWWNMLSNPPLDIGQQILEQVSNTMDLFWVDFTMEQIWPRTR